MVTFRSLSRSLPPCLCLFLCLSPCLAMPIFHMFHPSIMFWCALGHCADDRWWQDVLDDVQRVQPVLRTCCLARVCALSPSLPPSLSRPLSLSLHRRCLRVLRLVFLCTSSTRSTASRRTRTGAAPLARASRTPPSRAAASTARRMAVRTVGGVSFAVRVCVGLVRLRLRHREVLSSL